MSLMLRRGDLLQSLTNMSSLDVPSVKCMLVNHAIKSQVEIAKKLTML